MYFVSDTILYRLMLSGRCSSRSERHTPADRNHRLGSILSFRVGDRVRTPAGVANVGILPVGSEAAKPTRSLPMFVDLRVELHKGIRALWQSSRRKNHKAGAMGTYHFPAFAPTLTFCCRRLGSVFAFLTSFIPVSLELMEARSHSLVDALGAPF